MSKKKAKRGSTGSTSSKPGPKGPVGPEGPAGPNPRSNPVIAALDEAIGVAFDWTDLPNLFVVAMKTIKLVSPAAVGKVKKEVVLSHLRTFVSEKTVAFLDKHDVPWVPQIIESKLVDPALHKFAMFIFDSAAGSLIDVLNKVAKEGAEF